MNKQQSGFPEILQTTFLLFLILYSMSLLGCSSSDETTAQFTPPPQQQSTTGSMLRRLDGLRKENDSLRANVVKLEQDNRAANAKVSDLESQVVQLKDKLNSAPPPAPVTYTPSPTYAPPPTYTPPPTTYSPPPATSTPPPIISDVKTSYNEAVNQFKSRNYSDASAKFQAILDAGAGELEDHCHYWLGECKYATKDYQGALDNFNRVLSFSKSSKKDDAQFMIANTYGKMGDKSRAQEEYQILLDKYPASPLVKQAKVRMGKL